MDSYRIGGASFVEFPQVPGVTFGSSIPVKSGDAILEGPYPKSFKDFIGQVEARQELAAAVLMSRRLSRPVDHILFASGYPGIGKSTLARLTAHLMRAGFVELGGTTIREGDVVEALQVMEYGDVLFLDEIHRLATGGRAKAEWLLTLLQDGVIQTPHGAVKSPGITVIAATTEAQKLPDTILSRFAIQPRFSKYTFGESAQLGAVTARRLGFGIDVPIPVDDEWLYRVADAADRNPRRIGSILKAVQRTYFSEKDVWDGVTYDIKPALKWLGLTDDGLTSVQQTYLLTLLESGGKAGVGTIKAMMNESAIDHDERALIQKHMVTITPSVVSR